MDKTATEKVLIIVSQGLSKYAAEDSDTGSETASITDKVKDGAGKVKDKVIEFINNNKGTIDTVKDHFRDNQGAYTLGASAVIPSWLLSKGPWYQRLGNTGLNTAIFATLGHEMDKNRRLSSQNADMQKRLDDLKYIEPVNNEVKNLVGTADEKVKRLMELFNEKKQEYFNS